MRHSLFFMPGNWVVKPSVSGVGSSLLMPLPGWLPLGWAACCSLRPPLACWVRAVPQGAATATGSFPEATCSSAGPAVLSPLLLSTLLSLTLYFPLAFHQAKGGPKLSASSLLPLLVPLFPVLLSSSPLHSLHPIPPPFRPQLLPPGFHLRGTEGARRLSAVGTWALCAAQC